MVSGFSDQVLTQFTKMAATSLSSNTLGQVLRAFRVALFAHSAGVPFATSSFLLQY